MRTLLRFLFASAFVAACASSSPNDPPGPGSQNIHPQPQPNRKQLKFTAPCTPATCGEAPEALERPRCKPVDAACEWAEDQPVSYRLCSADECGEAPDAAICPSGTTSKGNECGSENDGRCAWTSVCVPPPSTIPCADPAGCGPKPEIAVVCSDGSIGDLACMHFETRCGWQATCD